MADAALRRILIPSLVLVAAAALPAQDARQIVEESQKRGRSDSLTYQGNLQVFGGSRNIAEKSWDLQRLGSYGNSSSILRFTAPADVKGVALLVINHPDRSADQWMWTPALERDRRIALQDRSTRFFGTDFSFEDLEERDAGQFDFRLTGEEAVGGTPCWRIESTPRKSKTSQYTSSRLWISQDHYVPLRLDNLIKDQVVRRLLERNVENIQGIWTPLLLEMTDLRRGSRTVLKMEKLRYNVPLRPEAFTIQALRLQP